MHLPHHVQPMTAIRASTTPAAVPPAIAATGISEVAGFETPPTVGKPLDPAVVTVVVTNDGKAGTLTVVKTGVGASRDVPDGEEELVVTSAEVEGIWDDWDVRGARERKEERVPHAPWYDIDNHGYDSVRDRTREENVLPRVRGLLVLDLKFSPRAAWRKPEDTKEGYQTHPQRYRQERCRSFKDLAQEQDHYVRLNVHILARYSKADKVPRYNIRL